MVVASWKLHPAAPHPNSFCPFVLAAVVSAGTAALSFITLVRKEVYLVTFDGVSICYKLMLMHTMQEDIRSLLPEALELIRNKLDVLRASHLDGFERTQLDALQLDVRLASDDMIMPVQIPTKHVETREGEVHVTKSSEFRPGPQLDKHRCTKHV